MNMTSLYKHTIVVDAASILQRITAACLRNTLSIPQSNSALEDAIAAKFAAETMVLFDSEVTTDEQYNKLLNKATRIIIIRTKETQPISLDGDDAEPEPYEASKIIRIKYDDIFNYLQFEGGQFQVRRLIEAAALVEKGDAFMTYVCRASYSDSCALIKIIDDGALVNTVKSIIRSVQGLDMIEKLEERGRAYFACLRDFAGKLSLEANVRGAAVFIYSVQDREIIDELATLAAKKYASRSFIIIYSLTGKSKIQKIIDLRPQQSADKLSMEDAYSMLHEWLDSIRNPSQQD